MKYSKVIWLVLLTATMVSSCSVNRFIPPDKKLLKKYEVRYVGKKSDVIDNSEVKAYLKPRANRSFLGTRYSLYLYYLSTVHKGKFYSWLNKKLGEDPVYIDQCDPDRIARNMQRFLSYSGFFNANISYQIKGNKKKSKIIFNITLGMPYVIDSVNYQIADNTIKKFIFNDTANSLVKPGNIYNAYTLDDERTRITDFLRNKGYYYFNQNYVLFKVDSNLSTHHLNIKTVITNRNIPDPLKLGSFIELPHYRYFVKEVEVIPDYNPTKYQIYKPFEHEIVFFGDSTYKYTYLLHMPVPRFKVKAFDQAIKIKQGLPYSSVDVQETYRRLFAMPIIKTATISFDTTQMGSDAEGNKYMKARIQMATGKLNFYSIDGVLTNSSGDPGVRGNLTIANKNIFRGAEFFRVRFNGGFEAQSISATDSISNGDNNNFFNTFEAGVDASLIFPRFVSPIPFRRFSQKYHPTTNITFGYNYLLRPNYSRNSTNLLLGYSWHKNTKIRFIFSPVNFNYINVNPTPEFQEILDQETNRRLKEQYSDHLIAGLNFSMVYDNQKIKTSKSFDYVRLDVETSGNLLYLTQKALNLQMTNNEYYRFMGIRYSQYVRINIDYRHYFHLNTEGQIIAFRGLAGAGIPYLNSNEIPYEKAFYAGGANDMRGWRFRTLGPGGYSGSTDYERTGDIQLETNIEYRFPIYSFLKGAFFTDIGNIWSYNSENYPNGQFNLKTFYKQLAVDGGFGLRFDFSYFIFRLDAGIPLRDPAYPDNERWRFGNLRFNQFIINFGIGYPF